MSRVPPDGDRLDEPNAVVLPLRPGMRRDSIPHFSIRLLGSFELTVDGQPVVLPISAQRLVALLALEGRTMSRRRVAGMLWPDKTDSRATANLRSALWRLNNCVEGLLVGDNGSVSMSDDVSLDIALGLAPDIVPDLARDIAPDLAPGVPNHLPDRGLPFVSAATASMIAEPPTQAELLVDWCDEWVVVERERIRQQTLRTLESAAGELRELGLFTEALQASSAAVKLAPLRESAHRSIIEVHLAEGNYAEAVRQYEAFSAIIFAAFGIRPSETMNDLIGHLPPKIQVTGF